MTDARLAPLESGADGDSGETPRTGGEKEAPDGIVAGTAFWSATQEPAAELAVEVHLPGGEIAKGVTDSGGHFEIAANAPAAGGVLVIHGPGALSEPSRVLGSEMRVPVFAVYGALVTIRDPAGNPPQADPRLFVEMGARSVRARNEGLRIRPLPEGLVDSLTLLGVDPGFFDFYTRQMDGFFHVGDPYLPSAGSIDVSLHLAGYRPHEIELVLEPFSVVTGPRRIELETDAGAWSPLQVRFSGAITEDDHRHSSRMPADTLVLASETGKGRFEVRVDDIHEPVDLGAIPEDRYSIGLRSQRFLDASQGAALVVSIDTALDSVVEVDLASYGSVRIVPPSGSDFSIERVRLLLDGSVARTDRFGEGDELVLEPVPEGTYSLQLSGEDLPLDLSASERRILVHPGRVTQVQL